jgi:hypothetical protein
LYQIIVGFISNFIIFPPLILIAMMFKKGKTLKKRENRIERGLKQGEISSVSYVSFYHKYVFL